MVISHEIGMQVDSEIAECQISLGFVKKSKFDHMCVLPLVRQTQIVNDGTVGRVCQMVVEVVRRVALTLHAKNAGFSLRAATMPFAQYSAVAS